MKATEATNLNFLRAAKRLGLSDGPNLDVVAVGRVAAVTAMRGIG